jgi:tetratricopeptide (TPR) repeat protein
MKRFLLTTLLITGLATSAVVAQAINPDDAVLALSQLKLKQDELRHRPAVKGQAQVNLINNMLKLGVWDRALQLIGAGSPASVDYQLLRADYLMLQNDFKGAELLVKRVLVKSPGNVKALRLKAALQMQAWQLPQAVATCKKALTIAAGNMETELVMGRALLLQKKYPAALAVAKKLEAEHPDMAGAYQLEADVYFWNQHPDQAEAPLKKSLSLNPFDADARFSYGYAIWRRVDATQLNAMAAQWEIALAVNPLHFSTHWHWGNGHTNLTYADYADANDDEVRQALKPADSLFSANKIAEAIQLTRIIQRRFNNSVLPLMYRGSFYYSSFDDGRQLRLDSAESIFKQVLARKKHYGPAHNGLSAVIKSKRIPYLAFFSQKTKELNNTVIPDMNAFAKVFPDVAYYPGKTAKAMAYNQLYDARVYFPFLLKQGNTFRVNSPSFRYNTTFDNRQWMDIRGVGSGAADIEYVERGAYLERNVILHEYTHLYHGRVLTDKENRQVRAHYYKAMAEHRTLDYYSQNNESEYFAQTYPAYFEPVKVHPLDFKSMNTRSDLMAKDPDMYQFIDGLVKKQKAYLMGNKAVMASNWSQVYLNLSNRARRGNVKMASAYLDTALKYDARYLPAYLAYARIKADEKDFASAEAWLKKAETIDKTYAPIYGAYAELVKGKYNARQIDQATAVNQQAIYYMQDLKLEDDYQERASASMQLREMYRRNGMIADAIMAAKSYSATAPVVSTYLRDRKDDADAYVASLRSGLGYTDEIKTLQHLVEQKPQNFDYRAMYAEALMNNKQPEAAIETLKQAQRILGASGNASLGLNLQIAECYQMLNEKDSVAKYVPAAKAYQNLKNEDGLRYIRLMAVSGKTNEAAVMLTTFKPEGDSFYMASYAYTAGKIQEAMGNKAEAAGLYESALKLNPYMFNLANWLYSYYNTNGQSNKAAELKSKSAALKIIPGAIYSNLIN